MTMSTREKLNRTLHTEEDGASEVFEGEGSCETAIVTMSPILYMSRALATEPEPHRLTSVFIETLREQLGALAVIAFEPFGDHRGLRVSKVSVEDKVFDVAQRIMGRPLEDLSFLLPDQRSGLDPLVSLRDALAEAIGDASISLLRKTFAIGPARLSPVGTPGALQALIVTIYPRGAAAIDQATAWRLGAVLSTFLLGRASTLLPSLDLGQSASILTAAGQYPLRWDTAAGVIEVAPELERWLGPFDDGRLELTPHPDEVSSLIERVQGWWADWSVLFETELRLRSGQGRWVRARLRCRASDPDEAGVPQVINGTLSELPEGRGRDVSGRRRLERVVDVAGDALLIVDAEGRVLEGNQRACHRLEYLRSELRRCDIWSLIDRSHHEVFRDALEGLSASGEGVIDVVHRAKSGALHAAEVGLRALELDGQPLVLCSSRDISLRRQAEALLTEQRLQSLGVLARGIAHDFNNLLASIVSGLGLAEMMLEPDHEASAVLEAVMASSLRGKDLTRRLLTFAQGGGETLLAPVPVDDLVAESIEVAARGSRHRCVVELSQGLWPVMADASQIIQALQNLILNAAQAMPEGGDIVVRAANLSVEQSERFGYQGRRMVRITVVDSGDGVAREISSRIFDPYFTTRRESAGLGLSTTFTIAQRHGGGVSFESQPGRGVEFSLDLPASDTSSSLPRSSPTPASTREMSILLMEEDDELRRRTRRLLEQLGCTVTAVDDGAAAVEVFQQALDSGHPVDLVMLDMTVSSGLGGEQALPLLQQRAPEVKAIMVTGYSSDMISLELADFKTTAVLPKPFSLAELQRVLQLLDGE